MEGIGIVSLYTSCNDCCIVHFIHCNLRWWCFSIHPLAQTTNLRSSNLHCVVVFFGGGGGGRLRVCGGGGCTYGGVMVVAKFVGVSLREY